MLLSLLTFGMKNPTNFYNYHRKRRKVEERWTSGNFSQTVLDGHTEGVYAIKLMKDPSSKSFKLVSGSGDGTVRWWNVNFKRSEIEFDEKPDEREDYTVTSKILNRKSVVNCIDCNRINDEDIVACGSISGSINVMRISDDGELMGAYETFNAGGEFVKIIFSPLDPLSLFTACKFDPKIKLWDVENCKKISEISTNAIIKCMAPSFGTFGECLVVGNMKGLSIADYRMNRMALNFDGGVVWNLCTSFDEKCQTKGGATHDDSQIFYVEKGQMKRLDLRYPNPSEFGPALESSLSEKVTTMNYQSCLNRLVTITYIGNITYYDTCKEGDSKISSLRYTNLVFTSQFFGAKLLFGSYDSSIQLWDFGIK
eukprot:TRINITY_DN6072_c0_g1_i3.p1 TRINITY_DN6072_c0_g1~~TRINITY_DN6072_c0_g1_i3.p1  ORF type:complete len:368 (-),score=90.53 TRINITY_DN6072_c0_g1_i3:929-2032(-)